MLHTVARILRRMVAQLPDHGYRGEHFRAG